MNNILRYKFLLVSNLNTVRPFAIGRKITEEKSTTDIINSSDSYKLQHPEGREPSIPAYTEKEDESITIKRARLLYQSRKRGMLENGLVLGSFAKRYLDVFNEEQLRQYDRLINLPSNDWDIFYWAAGVKPIPPEFKNEVMDLLKKHVRNEDKEARIAQPDL